MDCSLSNAPCLLIIVLSKSSCLNNKYSNGDENFAEVSSKDRRDPWIFTWPSSQTGAILFQHGTGKKTRTTIKAEKQAFYRDLDKVRHPTMVNSHWLWWKDWRATLAKKKKQQLQPSSCGGKVFFSFRSVKDERMNTFTLTWEVIKDDNLG